MSQIISERLQRYNHLQRSDAQNAQASTNLVNSLQQQHRDIILNNLAEKHGRFDFYYSKIVDKIVKDSPNQRIVAIFKDYLIFDDCSCECLRRLVPYEESKEKLKKLSEFYNDYADIFPSYALLLQPCEDERTLILKEKEGMAKYMYKNIRRKQRVIDEMFSIVERNKKKDANHKIESNQHVKNEPRRGYRPTRKNQNEMFFTPSFLNSVIKFEKTIAKKERITYLRKLTFQMSMEDLLDQFIEKDSQQIVSQENFYCGRVIEPLHLVDTIYHVELDRETKKRDSSKQRKQQSNSRSKSPIEPLKKKYPQQKQPMVKNQREQQNSRAENLVKRMHIPNSNPLYSNRIQTSRSPVSQRDITPNLGCATVVKNQTSQLRTPREINKKSIPQQLLQTQNVPSVQKVVNYNIRRQQTTKSSSKSPKRDIKTSVFVLPKKSQSSPIRESLEKRSPMKNIQNLVENNTHQILKVNHNNSKEIKDQRNNIQLTERIPDFKQANLPPSRAPQSPSRQIRKSSIASHNALSPSRFSQTSAIRTFEISGYQSSLINPSNKSTSLMLGQSIKMLLKANKQNVSTHQNHLSNISEMSQKAQNTSGKRHQPSTAKKDQLSTQYETPSKNTVRSREVSGSKGRLHRQNFASQNLELFSSQITSGGQPNVQIIQTTKFVIPDDEESKIMDQSQVDERIQNTSRIRESLIKKPVTKAAYRNTFKQNQLEQSAFNKSEDQIISMNFLKQHQQMKREFQNKNGGT